MVFIIFFLLLYAPTLYGMQRLEASEHPKIIEEFLTAATYDPGKFDTMLWGQKSDGTSTYNALMLVTYAANQIQNKTHETDVTRRMRKNALEAIPYQKAHTPTAGCNTSIDCLVPDQKPEMGAIAAGIEIDIGKEQSTRLFSTH